MNSPLYRGSALWDELQQDVQKSILIHVILNLSTNARLNFIWKYVVLYSIGYIHNY